MKDRRRYVLLCGLCKQRLVVKHRMSPALPDDLCEWCTKEGLQTRAESLVDLQVYP